ncbi:MAG: hypothetical protein JRE47_11250 [Deltaproteobacteria bacterium]|nr:hypothetical protein [Deltaproteobacteria bacterium]
MADRKVVRGDHGYSTAWKESEHGLLVEINSLMCMYRDGQGIFLGQGTPERTLVEWAMLLRAGLKDT